MYKHGGKRGKYNINTIYTYKCTHNIHLRLSLCHYHNNKCVLKILCACSSPVSRQEEQGARVLPGLAEEQDPAQRPRGGEEAGLDHRGGDGRLCALQSWWAGVFLKIKATRGHQGDDGSYLVGIWWIILSHSCYFSSFILKCIYAHQSLLKASVPSLGKSLINYIGH